MAPLGLPWWVPIIAFATMFGVLVGVRSVARHRLRGWWSGLAVMRETGPRTKVIALVTLGICFQIARNWLLLRAVGVDASVFDATAVIIAVAFLGTLPLGPSTGAGGMVLILGAGGVAAVAAAGVLLTATGAVGALAYAAWALVDRLLGRPAPDPQPRHWIAAGRDRHTPPSAGCPPTWGQFRPPPGADRAGLLRRAHAHPARTAAARAAAA